jgi:hypothetical protein
MGIELADIFRRYGNLYRQKYATRMPSTHLKAMRAIEQCRTEALGGQTYRCPGCEYVLYSYHSCRNRHCPKCQNENAQRWLEKQQHTLLPVPYFLLTFTLADELGKVARSHSQLFYDLLFRISAAATQQLATDPRFIGGQIGMIGVPHTWGRNLVYHPHVHYLVPAGGLAPVGSTWLPARKNFLLPVRALSRLFRGKFHQALRNETCYQQIPDKVWKQDWVVHCEPVGSGLGALKYLAPYIFRVAIPLQGTFSNNRLIKLENDQVTFRYRDTKSGKEKRCTLGAEEFIRRFLQHVLPRSFVKLRYYGLFSPSLRKKLSSLRQNLEGASGTTTQDQEPDDHLQTEPSQSGSSPSKSPIRCPVCGCNMQPRPLIVSSGPDPP